jgi:hypothetical protein
MAAAFAGESFVASEESSWYLDKKGYHSGEPASPVKLWPPPLQGSKE